MHKCVNCGAPIQLRPEPVQCGFCDAINAPPPEQVEVPVPVQFVQNVVTVTGGAASEALELRCPHCRKRLVSVRVGEINLSGCGSCGGIWVENECARRLIGEPQRVVIELANRASANARNRSSRSPRPVCPSCPAILDRLRSHGLDLDVCGEHGTWFDAGELAALVSRLLGAKTRQETPAKPPERVRCVECRTEVASRAINIGINGPTCDACWRAHQAELIARADRQNREGAAGLLLGALGAAVVGLSAATASSNRS